VFPKGVRSGLWIYEVLAVGAPFDLVLPLRSERWVRLVEPMAIGVVLLDDKDASQPRRSARIVALSEWGAQVELESELGLPEFAPFSTVKLSWVGAIGGEELEAYAKVVDRDEPGCWLRFTARSVEAVADCDRWRDLSIEGDDGQTA
jgi:hypothetical protein